MRDGGTFRSRHAKRSRKSRLRRLPAADSSHLHGVSKRPASIPDRYTLNWPGRIMRHGREKGKFHARVRDFSLHFERCDISASQNHRVFNSRISIIIFRVNNVSSILILRTRIIHFHSRSHVKERSHLSRISNFQR